MGASLNKVLLIGRLGRDPEVRETPGGQTVANFSVATDETWKGKDGEKHEKTEWHRIVVWGRQAEIAGEYLRKGTLVYIEGSLETRKWEKDGVDRYSTEVKCFRFQMLSAKGERHDPPARRDEPAPAPRDEDLGPPAEEDDIPF